MAVDDAGNWVPDAIGLTRHSLEDIIEKKLCGKKQRIEFKLCPGCHQKVAIHCSDCGIQTTGCMCLVLERNGHEIANEKARRAGLILPDDPRFDPSKLHG